MTHVIYLAAGASRRFGADKLLADYNGKPLFSYGLRTLVGACTARPDADLTVVTNTPAVAEAARMLGAQVTPSPRSAQGQSYSIRAGLDAVEPLGAGDFLLFAVADQPRLRPETVNRVLDLARPGTWAATAACGDRVGNPGLFCAALAPALRELQGDKGGRAVLNRHPERLVRVECLPEELQDIDTPADLP